MPSGSRLFFWGLFAATMMFAGCHFERSAEGPDVPRGYVDRLEIRTGKEVVGFGPFVGYYFTPEDPEDLSRLRFVCYNERQFYTRDLPENALLFTGDARLAALPDTVPESIKNMTFEERISPIFFPEAPRKWLDTRPRPAEGWNHFHSCYNASGAVLVGYWLRHVGTAEFTYNMGERVDPGSPLHHHVTPGPDNDFARIVEFDRGPLPAHPGFSDTAVPKKP